jgi:hypothetical protein
MTVTSGATQSTDRHSDLNEMRTSPSPHVIEFFTAREQMHAHNNWSADPFRYRLNWSRFISAETIHAPSLIHCKTGFTL